VALNLCTTLATLSNACFPKTHNGLAVGGRNETVTKRLVEQIKRIRLSNAPVLRLCLVLHLSDERSGISTEAAESGRGGEAGCGV
jgi:hypothetical protein